MAAASKPLLIAARAILFAAVVACLAGPWLFDANSLTVLTEFFVVLTLALDVEPARRLRRHHLGRSAGLRRRRRLRLLRLHRARPSQRLARRSARGADDARRRRPRDGGHLSPANRLSRGRHLGRSRRADADRRQAAGLRRRLRHQFADPGRQAVRRAAGRAHRPLLCDEPRAGADRLRRHLGAAAVAGRASA